MNLTDLLAGNQTVAISGHIRPDGDCVGSCMGLYLYLTENYPQIQADVYLEEIPPAYRMIERTKEVKHRIAEEKSYDLMICLDCGDEKRLGFSEPLLHRAKKTVCIDHHISNQAFADENQILPEASSTSELVYRLLDYDKISKSCAEALYMGIAHDTGVFRYSCTAPETMEAAAALMRKGILFSQILDKTYYEQTYVQNKMLGKALKNSRLLLNGQCIVSAITEEEMKEVGASPADLEGIVSQLRQTEGVEVAVFLYETAPGEYKVSLRSVELIDVSRIAGIFGGGGHVKAAGCTIRGKKEEIVSRIREQITLQLMNQVER